MKARILTKEMSRGEGGAIAKVPTKKEQIVSLWQAGITGVRELAQLTGTRASYVATVLQGGGGLHGYFDLYTTSQRPMNVYSQYFASKLGFKDVPTARRSVHCLDLLYRQFQRTGDRAGQHHVMVMGLTMFNRARWSGKEKEAGIFGKWLTQTIADANHAEVPEVLES